MRRKLHKMLLGAPAPQRLHFDFNWLREDAGLHELEEWLRGHRETGLVIIDTFAKICRVKQGTYDADYEAIAKFKGIANRHKIAIVLVHHMRKTGAKDEFDVVNGSTGLTGAADTIALLYRQRFQAEGTLSITGRNQKEVKLALQFDKATGIWEIREQAEGVI